MLFLLKTQSTSKLIKSASKYFLLEAGLHTSSQIKVLCFADLKTVTSVFIMSGFVAQHYQITGLYNLKILGNIMHKGK